MRLHTRWAVLLAVLALLVAAVPAAADHDTFPSTRNMHALGHSPQPGTFEVPDGQRVISSDLAFQGRYIYQGNYDGFRVIRNSPGNPQLVGSAECNGDQGDIVVYEDILVRSWNTKRAEPRACGDTMVPAGFEGVHVFDISDPTDPQLVTAVEMPCGSHTATVAGVVDGDLIVYSNNSSGGGCTGGSANGDFMDVIAVPLDDPAAAALVDRVPLAGPTTAVTPGCHDAAVILGDVHKAACASADTINVWDITDPLNPVLEFTIFEPGVGEAGTNGRWHSAGFSWDGDVLAMGWEPGGGGAGECEADDPDIDKTLFFYDANTGAKLGEWVLPRAQGADENCTIHNYNMVPLRSGRDVVVMGNYQAGTWVVDFTDPSNPETVAWADPPSLGPGSFCGGICQIGGAWSTYWYNNFIYESDITRGLNVYRLSSKVTGGAIRLDRLNPQTQDFSL